MSTDFQNKHSSFLKKLVFLFHFITCLDVYQTIDSLKEKNEPS